MPTVHSLDVEAELSVLNALTAPAISIPTKHRQQFDSEMEPILLAAAVCSDPHVTRNHYAHDFFPAVGDPSAPGAWDWTKWTSEQTPSSKQDPNKARYVSRQAPRRQRLRALGLPVDDIESSDVSPERA
jgi:GTP cyclohydrolase II